MSNSEDSVKSSLYSSNNINNENSVDSPDKNSLIKIFDSKEEEWTFNKKLNENNIPKNEESDKKAITIDNSNKAIINDKENNIIKINDIKIEDKEYINLKRNIINSNDEENNSQEIFLNNDKSNSNKSVMKKLLFTEMSNSSFKENENEDNKKNNNIENIKSKNNEIILTEQNSIKKNFINNNLSPCLSGKESKNSMRLFTYTSNKENFPFLFNINNQDKISYNSFTLLNNKNSKIFNESPKLSLENNKNNSNLDNKEKKDFSEINKAELNNTLRKKTKLNHINNKSDLDSNKILSKFTNENQINIDITNLDGTNLIEFLKEIDLLCYYNLFIKKGIYSFEKVIKDIKEEKFKISKSDFEEIGIEKFGHIYRIITKLEVESECIEKKISKEILSYSVYFTENNLFNSTEYFCNCCSSFKEKNIIISNQMKFNLDSWLKKNNLSHLKDNFINNGYDKMEYMILQMFSSIPINDYILKNELNILNENDRNIILFQLNKDIKRVLKKINRKENVKKNIIHKSEESCFVF